jgi:hypothetical protein
VNFSFRQRIAQRQQNWRVSETPENYPKWKVFEVLNKHDFILSFNSQIRKSEKQKTFDERNGESDRSGDRSSSFIVNKARISVQLQLQLNSLRKGVVCLEAWIWQVMVWAIITWETSTMVPLSCAPQDRIFHIHVWLDIWRCRPTRINVRLNTPHRKAMNSNGNQVCRVFSWTQWECICSSVMKLADLILLQSSHSPLTIDTETLGLSITGEKYTVVSRQHMVTCSCSPSLPLCSVVRCFKADVLFFLKKQVRNRKNMKISANRWELKINKDCENSQSLWF